MLQQRMWWLMKNLCVRKDRLLGRKCQNLREEMEGLGNYWEITYLRTYRVILCYAQGFISLSE